MSAGPSRTGTVMSAGSEPVVPDDDPNSAPGLFDDRLAAWRFVVTHLEDYITTIAKTHKAQAKEYERALKTISQPLRHGENFDQNVGGITGFFDNMRANTEALIRTSTETEKSIEGSVLPVLARLIKEIKNKGKELAHGVPRATKEVEKARHATQKQIELLGQHTASFDSTGGRMSGADDPYVVRRGVMHRLHRQVLEENNHRNEVLSVQSNFKSFEAHILSVIQGVMESFSQLAGGQGERVRLLYSDMLGAVQRIPPDHEWKGFVERSGDRLPSAAEPARSADAVAFPNMDHHSAQPLIEGSLERKSRNKLAWGYQTAYYVVTPSKYLHEFKDDDDARHEPKPELSIYLPEALIGAPTMDKFAVKGKDRSHKVSSKLTGSAELAFKAHTAADADRWYEILRTVAGPPPGELSSPISPIMPTSPTSLTSPTAAQFEGAGAGAGAGRDETPTLVSPVTAAASQGGSLDAVVDGDGHETGVAAAPHGEDRPQRPISPADLPRADDVRLKEETS